MPETFEDYGIDTRDAKKYGMNLAEYYKIEFPEAYKKAVEIPPELTNKIEKFGIIWNLPVLDTYALRRDLNYQIAIREIIQNALDAEHEKYGYENINVRVFTDEIGTHVIDRGKGMSWHAFLLGKSEKPAWARGRFGEGLNLATLFFATENIPVYILSRNCAYKTIYNKKEDTFTIVIGRLKYRIDGTHVIMYKWTPPDDVKVEKLYWKTTPGLSILSIVKYTPKPDNPNYPPMPNMIFRDDSKNKKLYVRDIYVNDDCKLVSNPFFYTYNLWWVDLETNRVNIKYMGEFDLRDAVRDVLLRSPQQLLNFMHHCLKRATFADIVYYTLQDAEDYYEGDINFSVSVIEKLPNEVKSRLVEGIKYLVQSNGITCVEYVRKFDILPAVNHERGKVLFVPSGFFDLFRISGIASAESFVESSLLSSLSNVIRLDEKLLTYENYIKLAKYRVVAKAFTPLQPDTIKVYPIKGRSHTIKGTIMIDLSEDAATFIHELAHAYGDIRNYDTSQHGEMFVRMLEEVGSKILELTTRNKTVRNALIRVENGVVSDNNLKHMDNYYFEEEKFIGIPFHKPSGIKYRTGYNEDEGVAYDTPILYIMNKHDFIIEVPLIVVGLKIRYQKSRYYFENVEVPYYEIRLIPIPITLKNIIECRLYPSSPYISSVESLVNKIVIGIIKSIDALLEYRIKKIPSKEAPNRYEVVRKYMIPIIKNQIPTEMSIFEKNNYGIIDDLHNSLDSIAFEVEDFLKEDRKTIEEILIFGYDIEKDIYIQKTSIKLR